MYSYIRYKILLDLTTPCVIGLLLVPMGQKWVLKTKSLLAPVTRVAHVFLSPPSLPQEQAVPPPPIHPPPFQAPAPSPSPGHTCVMSPAAGPTARSAAATGSADPTCIVPSVTSALMRYSRPPTPATMGVARAAPRQPAYCNNSNNNSSSSSIQQQQQQQHSAAAAFSSSSIQQQQQHSAAAFSSSSSTQQQRSIV